MREVHGVRVVVARARMDRRDQEHLERSAIGLPAKYATERVIDRILNKLVNIELVDDSATMRDQSRTSAREAF